MGKPIIKKRESALLEYVSVPSEYKKHCVEPCVHETKAAERLGHIGWICLAVWTLAILSPQYPEMLYLVDSGTSILVLIPILFPIASILIGYALIRCIVNRNSIAYVSVDIFCILLWPILLGMYAFRHPLSVPFSLSISLALILVSQEPRWLRMKTHGRNLFCIIEKSLYLVLPFVVAVAFDRMNGTHFIEGFWLHFFLFAACLFPTIVGRSCLWSFIRYLAALRHPEDDQGQRTTLIVMATIWFMPLIMSFDRYGWFITGGQPRAE